jgi:uncharacterized protein (TIRG00374 family)
MPELHSPAEIPHKNPPAGGSDPEPQLREAIADHSGAKLRPRRISVKGVTIMSLQMIITAGGIWFVFRDPQKRLQIVEALRNADVRWLIAGWVCYGGVEIIATLRWQILLRIQGISLGWWRAGGLVVTGLFFNLFLPGLIGGDAMRSYFVVKSAPQRRSHAILSVAMDRIFGLLSLVFLAALSLGLRYDWFRRAGATGHIVHLTIALLACALGFVVFLFLLAGLDLPRRLPGRFPFRKGIGEASDALRIYRTHLLAMTAAFLVTLVSHGLYYLCFYCAGQSLHGSGAATASLRDILSIMPLVNTVTALPISMGGVGVREMLFQELLGQLAHVPSAIAALTASLGFALQASWGLLGAAAFLWSQKITSSPCPKGQGERQAPSISRGS